MKWKTLQHNGILFPPEYKAQGIKLKIRGKPVKLSLLQEEMVYQWAKKKDTPYVQDVVFQKNFTADFAREMGTGFENIKYEDIDFADAYRIVDIEKDRREMMTKEEKKELAAQRKKLREQMKEKYGTAIMDGRPVEVANYMAEPPGIFIGRGAHPLRGRWKRRIQKSDVTLNLGKDAKVPPGDWGKIVCQKDSIWLASWPDELTQKTKYVWFADTAGVKQERDKAKYEKAIKLSRSISKVRDKMILDMKSKDPRERLISTACYLIFRTAMRVGDEKDPDEADTVGATTLRKEHIAISDDAIKFDFLGKDSVRWQENITVSGDDIQFQKNLKELVAGKKSKQDIFEGITSRHVNAYYSGILKGLTAKVFRTYLGSQIICEYLKQHDKIGSKSAATKLYHAKMANLDAAKMLNHKRTIPKTFQKSLEKKKETLKKAKLVNPKTEKQKERKKERLEKLKLQIDLAEKTRDYNLGTSLRNYIDPRVFKSWSDEVDAQWEKLYTAALQKKFLWVADEKLSWKSVSRQY